MYWDWRKTIGGMLRIGIMLLCFSSVFQNRILLNKEFLPQLPVGFILLFLFGILILRHICRTLRWYSFWLKKRKNFGNVILHSCLYLIVISLVLSISISLDRLTVPNNMIITPNNMTKHFNKTVQDAESINGSKAGQSHTDKIPVVIVTVPIAEMTSAAVRQGSDESSYVVKQYSSESPRATEQDSSGLIDLPQYMTNPKTVNYEYILRGTHSQIPYIVYGGMNNYLKSQPRYIISKRHRSPPKEIDFIMKNLNNENQRQLLDPLFEEIQKITPTRDDQARIAISLVQNLNYDWDSCRSGNMKGKYPYEVLYTGCGVCSGKSELLAYLLRGLGYGVVIFRFDASNDFPGHDAVGIKCPQQYGYRDTGYCFVESTSPSIITDSSGDYVVAENSTAKLITVPKILKICDGNSFDSVLEEYNDAVTWNNICKLKVLDEYNYNRWLSLVNKYGIKITKN